jgi:hypothetical protein
MDTQDKVNALKQFALAHYDEGGHWIYECCSDADYVRVLDEFNGDVERAKRMLREDWEFTNERQQECAWGAPGESADPGAVGCEFDGKINP